MAPYSPYSAQLGDQGESRFSGWWAENTASLWSRSCTRRSRASRWVRSPPRG